MINRRLSSSSASADRAHQQKTFPSCSLLPRTRCPVSARSGRSRKSSSSARDPRSIWYHFHRSSCWLWVQYLYDGFLLLWKCSTECIQHISFGSWRFYCPVPHSAPKSKCVDIFCRTHFLFLSSCRKLSGLLGCTQLAFAFFLPAYRQYLSILGDVQPLTSIFWLLLVLHSWKFLALGLEVDMLFLEMLFRSSWGQESRYHNYTYTHKLVFWLENLGTYRTF